MSRMDRLSKILGIYEEYFNAKAMQLKTSTIEALYKQITYAFMKRNDVLDKTGEQQKSLHCMHPKRT